MAGDLLDDFAPSEQWARKPTAQPVVKLDPLASVVTLDAPTEAQMLDYYDNPHKRPKGETTHIPLLDPIFKWVPGWTNFVTAFPNVGKGQFTRELLLHRVIFAGKKALLWAPEDMPREIFYETLAYTLTGQTPDSTSQYAVCRKRYQLAMQWLREKFYVVQPVKGQGKTCEHILDIFEAARAKLGIEHFALDPWHKLDHGGMMAAGGERAYLSRELDRMTSWCSDSQVFLNVTVNPKKLTRPPGEQWPVPDSDHLPGTAAWDDFAGTIMAFDRPNRHTTRADPAFAIYTRKIKSYARADARPGSIGVGSEDETVQVEFDWKASRYMFNSATALVCNQVHEIFAPELVNAHHAPRTSTLPASTFDTDMPVNAFRAAPPL